MCSSKTGRFFNATKEYESPGERGDDESAVSSGSSVEEPVAGAAVAAAVAAPVIGEEPPAKRPKVKHNLSGRASYQSFLEEGQVATWLM